LAEIDRATSWRQIEIAAFVLTCYPIFVPFSRGSNSEAEHEDMEVTPP
jgi:hypothetical protein